MPEEKSNTNPDETTEKQAKQEKQDKQEKQEVQTAFMVTLGRDSSVSVTNINVPELTQDREPTVSDILLCSTIIKGQSEASIQARTMVPIVIDGVKREYPFFVDAVMRKMQGFMQTPKESSGGIKVVPKMPNNLKKKGN